MKFPFIPVTFMEHTFEHPLFNEYPDPVFTMDLKGNFVSVNKSLVRLAECSKEEVLKMSFTSFLLPEHLEDIFEIFKRATAGEIQDFETDVISSKGTLRTLSIKNIPIVSGGVVKGVYAIAQDITETKKTERKLSEYNHRISTILESITDGFYAIDKNSIVTYWNREAERLLRVPKSKIIGKNLWEVFKEAVPLKFYTEYKISIESQVSRRFEEYFPPLACWYEVTTFPSEGGLSVYFKDITKRKKTEKELRVQKERYKDLFNQSPLPQWVYDLDTLKFLDVNKAAIEHYGYSKEEFLSMTIKEIRPPEEIQALEDILKTEVRPKNFHRAVVVHQKKTGEKIMVRVDGNPINYKGKNARLILAVDETDKIKATEALQASEKRFKAMVQDGSDLIAILNKNGNYSYVSPNSKLVFGIEDKDLINQNIFSLVHEDDKQLLADKLLILSNGQHIKVPPFRLKDSEGSYRWIEMLITDMSDDAAISGIIANARDITQRMQNNLKTQESIERFNTVSKATSDAIWDWDFLTGQVDWNKGITGIYGHKHTSYSHNWWLDHVHPEDVQKLVEKLDSLIKNKESKMITEYRFQCADGSYKFVLDRAFLIFSDNGEPKRMIGSMQDISERINYIQSIEEQNERLRDIGWIQSHLVRAPLARILGLSKLIYDKDTDAELRKELLSYLDISATELDNVISEIVKKSEEIVFKESFK